MVERTKTIFPYALHLFITINNVRVFWLQFLLLFISLILNTRICTLERKNFAPLETYPMTSLFEGSFSSLRVATIHHTINYINGNINGQ